MYLLSLKVVFVPLSTTWKLFSHFSAGLRFFSGNYRCSFNREQEADGKRICITSVHWDHCNHLQSESTGIKLRLSPAASPKLGYIADVTIELQSSSWLRLWPTWPCGGCESKYESRTSGGLEIETGCKRRRTSVQSGIWAKETVDEGRARAGQSQLGWSMTGVSRTQLCLDAWEPYLVCMCSTK